jgi:2-oxoglutarate ferredoxin oxidoreductase subunit alpha
MEKMLITGNEAAVLGAIDAGAKAIFGYPITPATEILEGFIAKAQKDNSLICLQTEDEIAAGFGVLGAVLGGVKAFTASAGPGHILLQDAISMAENMRLPFVGIMMQRGGPSTGTVNFSQQEVHLAAFGGNGDGLRIVYSASSVAEMYDLVIKAFSAAWKYRFPTIVLGDGYLGKMKQNVVLKKQIKPIQSEKILLETKEPTHLRNCYSSESEFGEMLAKNVADWNALKTKIIESESFRIDDARDLIISHGLVASAAKEAVSFFRKGKSKIGLFRPITLHPLDVKGLKAAVVGKKRVFIVESALNQLSRLIKYELSGMKLDIIEINKPAQGFTPDEIIKEIRKHNG